MITKTTYKLHKAYTLRHIRVASHVRRAQSLKANRLTECIDNNFYLNKVPEYIAFFI